MALMPVPGPPLLPPPPGVLPSWAFMTELKNVGKFNWARRAAARHLKWNGAETPGCLFCGVVGHRVEACRVVSAEVRDGYPRLVAEFFVLPRNVSQLPP